MILPELFLKSTVNLLSKTTFIIGKGMPMSLKMSPESPKAHQQFRSGLSLLRTLAFKNQRGKLCEEALNYQSRFLYAPKTQRLVGLATKLCKDSESLHLLMYFIFLGTLKKCNLCIGKKNVRRAKCLLHQESCSCSTRSLKSSCSYQKGSGYSADNYNFS
ncbi:unnamed protein product [Moneuplotes crassus]|uniref:Uncharacterized protein n=1 Tax=Euplotes crassus TaxID=5936 RepID=A0AAD1UC79_EUPCR|nr:unnamed protein product [Moneuplotes crassus]